MTLHVEPQLKNSQNSFRNSGLCVAREYQDAENPLEMVGNKTNSCVIRFFQNRSPFSYYTAT